mmetsp:Transcript_135649/g.351667  ORF Transcript_135649/g.351667 Transcript_135649/m.351667 type:complete len:552 (-) Transcript_135649:27-1682(-)
MSTLPPLAVPRPARRAFAGRGRQVMHLLWVVLLLCVAVGAAAAADGGVAEATFSEVSSVYRRALDEDAGCQAPRGDDDGLSFSWPEDPRCQSLLQRDMKALAVDVDRPAKVFASAPPRVPDIAVGPAAPLTPQQMRAEKLKFAIPCSAIVLGGLCILAGHYTLGLIAVYFGSQSGLSLYMKVVLSEAVISRELEINGIPAPFLVTAAQQFVCFCVMVPCSLISYYSGGGPRKLTARHEWISIVCYSAAFAGNFGLNNLSLSLIAVSLNLIIRSCLPLVTLLAQLLVGVLVPGSKEASMRVRRSEVMFMIGGMMCAGLATVAGGAGGGTSTDEDTAQYVCGVVVCVGSVFAAALNLVVARLLGHSMEMNPLEATLYTSLPSGMFLLVPSFTAPHPVAWPGYKAVTDWQVFLRILELSPATLGYVLLSGVFAAAYNILQYVLVQYLSATHTAFAGNFNKAATIFLSIALGLEALPSGAWGAVMVLAVLGNILSFTGFSLLKAAEKKTLQRSSSESSLDSRPEARPPSSIGSPGKLRPERNPQDRGSPMLEPPR